MTEALDRTRWLMLIHQLPKEPAYLRVKVGRRLAHLGAVALKSSVYVLPKTDGTVEDFQWMRQEITDAGGDATVVEASVVSGISDESLKTRFRAAKDAQYAELADEARATKKQALGRRKRALTADERTQLLSEVSRLEARFHDLRETDFFGATGAVSVAGLLNELRTVAEPPSVETTKSTTPQRPPKAYTWVTRAGVRVDRIASAWLVRRFIDAEAEFKFVAPKGYLPAAGELRFDMPDAEYSHEADACTFEVLCTKFGLEVPGLRALAELVHDLDVKDGKFQRPQNEGVVALIEGIAQLHDDDNKRIAAGSVVFDALLAYFATRKA